MSQPTAFEKRIRRRVTGRMQMFFVVTAPGLEDLCYQEIRSLPIPPNDISREKGGILFHGRVHDGYKANLLLRTASRILMRLGEFKATNFRQLQKKLSEFEWELYLQPAVIPQIQVTARHSRLFHSDAIASHFQDAIRRRFESLDSGLHVRGDSIMQQALYVRISDDLVTISIDSSGAILHKRGLKTHASRAPVRETVAAAALKLAGFTGGIPLVDPMCGSGTFSLEGAMIAHNIPAGWFRAFAFEAWPCFRPEMWNFIRREESEKMANPNQVLIFASDTDEAACKRLTETVSACGLQNTISVSQQDFFNTSGADYGECGLVVINPPYGIRIGTPQNSRKLWHDILNKLTHAYSGWNFALVVPRDMIDETIRFPMKIHPVFHGGMQLVIALGRIQN